MATSKKYEFWVSKQMEVGKVKVRLMEQISQYEKNQQLFQNPEEIFMFKKECNRLLEESLTIDQMQMKSGDQIVLI